jgi:hypothetical protein
MGDRIQLAKQPTNLTGDAAVRSHAYKRMDRMTLMGLILPKLIAVAKVPPPWNIDNKGATIQAGKGSAIAKTQAAHNLPRDLTLNGRSLWEFVKDTDNLDIHPRIKLQFFYSSAATMTVPYESNYIDSRWEESQLVQLWLRYIDICVHNASGLGTSAPLDGKIQSAAINFKQACRSTLDATISRIHNLDYYLEHQDVLEKYFVIYDDAICRYDTVRRLADLWSIYQNEKYQ